LRLSGAAPHRRSARQAWRAVDPHAREDRGRPPPQVVMRRRHLCCAAALCLAGLTVVSGQAPTSGYVWNLPTNFPKPRVPASNPMSNAKVELGRHLFYDKRLSGNGSQACATCHEQQHAFADSHGQAVGSTGEVHPRGSMSLVNVAYAAALTWGNPTLTELEMQALVPMFGDHPVELGLKQPGTAMLARLRSEPRYGSLFAAAFGSEPDPVTLDHVTQALASFERTIVSARSPYDRYRTERDDSAISASARRGETLFMSRPLSCFRCHGGFTLSGAVTYDGRRSVDIGGVGVHKTCPYNIPAAPS